MSLLIKLPYDHDHDGLLELNEHWRLLVDLHPAADISCIARTWAFFSQYSELFVDANEVGQAMQ
jgi:hypothetical protein